MELADCVAGENIVGIVVGRELELTKGLRAAVDGQNSLQRTGAKEHLVRHVLRHKRSCRCRETWGRGKAVNGIGCGPTADRHRAAVIERGVGKMCDRDDGCIIGGMAL